MTISLSFGVFVLGLFALVAVAWLWVLTVHSFEWRTVDWPARLAFVLFFVALTATGVWLCWTGGAGIWVGLA